jgi:uncharacterized Tic20 family protein
MKTLTKSKSNQQIDAFWVSIVLLLSFAAFVSIALHISPLHIISMIEDFATHHFVLVVMIAFLIAMLSLRQFYANRGGKSSSRLTRNNSLSKTTIGENLKESMNFNYTTIKDHITNFWISIALFCLLIIVLALALHTTPSHMIALVENFATHHFVLAAMLCFFIALMVLRHYYKSFSPNQQITFLRKKSRADAQSSLIGRFKNKVNLDYQTLKSNFIGILQIESLTFSEEDILNDNEQKVKRENDLNRAMKLGNSYKEKVKIYFKDEYSNKHVYTSVWFVSSTHVTLKHGVVIPIKAIYDVKF